MSGDGVRAAGSGRPPIVHVGPTKTASTWLQEVVFPQLEGVEVLGRKPADRMNSRDRELLGATWAMVSDSVDDYAPGGFGDLVAHASPAGGGRLLVADEGILSTMRYRSREQLDRTADRLHHDVPDAQIVIVIRNPVTLMSSTYRHYVRRGGTLGVERFCRASGTGFTFCPEVFDMGYLVGLFRDRYGSDNVVIVLYEELAADPGRVLATLTASLGVEASPELVSSVDRSAPRNASLSFLACGLLRRTNRLFASRYHPEGRIRRPSQGRVSGRVRRLDRRLDLGRRRFEQRLADRADTVLSEVGRQYAHSHVRLAASTGLDLRGHRYPWPD